MEKRSISLVGPLPPPYGGMAVQMKTMADKLRQENVRVEVIRTNQSIPKPLSKLKGIRTAVNSIWFLMDLMKKMRLCDVVYVFGASHLYFFLCVFPSFVVAKLFKKRFFLNYRGGGPHKFFKRYRWLVRFVMNRADVVVPSEYLRGVIEDLLNIKSKVIPNLTYMDSFKFKPRKFFSHKLICSRNFEKIYNVGCVIKSFAIIKKRYKDTILGLIGEGSEEKSLKRLVRELGLESSVKFFGKVSHSELPKIYEDYSVFLNSSDVDNFPASILEAMSSGLVVITTGSGGIPCIVEDGKTGFLIEKNDHISMADKVMYVFENSDRALEITKRARKQSEKFEWKNIKETFFKTVFGETNG